MVTPRSSNLRISLGKGGFGFLPVAVGEGRRGAFGEGWEGGGGEGEGEVNGEGDQRRRGSAGKGTAVCDMERWLRSSQPGWGSGCFLRRWRTRGNMEDVGT